MSDEVTDENGRFLWYKYASTKVLLPLAGMGLWGFLIYTKAIAGTEMLYVGGGLLAFCGLLTASDAIQLMGRKKEGVTP